MKTPATQLVPAGITAELEALDALIEAIREHRNTLATEPLPVEALRYLLDYDPGTGAFTWRERDAALFGSAKEARRWNGRYAGTPAGSVNHGYVRITIRPRHYAAHRLAWAISHGEHPVGEIDHINHCRSDNRLANLRQVNDAGNAQNASLRRDNVSGAAGVIWRAKNQKWEAYISADGKPRHLGSFLHFDDALAVRKDAERKHGFHPNHGRIAHAQ